MPVFCCIFLTLIVILISAATFAALIDEYSHKLSINFIIFIPLTMLALSFWGISKLYYLGQEDEAKEQAKKTICKEQCKENKVILCMNNENNTNQLLILCNEKEEIKFYHSLARIPAL